MVKAAIEARWVILRNGEDLAGIKQAAAFDLLALSVSEMASHHLIGHLTGLILSGNVLWSLRLMNSMRASSVMQSNSCEANNQSIIKRCKTYNRSSNPVLEASCS